MTQEEALKAALDALHKIALGAHARQQVDEGRLSTNEWLRIGQIQRAMTVSEIEDFAINTWEEIVSCVDDLEGRTIFDCNPDDADMTQDAPPSSGPAPEGK